MPAGHRPGGTAADAARPAPTPSHTTTSALGLVPSHASTPAASSAFLPGTAGVAAPPSPERHRQSWTTEDRNLWGLPGFCVPALIEGA